MENRFIAEIRKLLDTLDPRSFSLIVMNKYKEYYQDVLDKTSFLDSKSKLKWRLVFYLNDIHEYPRCRVCGNICNRTLKRDNMTDVINDPYPIYYCSQKCAIGSDEVKKKVQDTLKKKYGELGLANPIIRQKSLETYRRKYNVDNISQLQSTKDKVAQTMIEHYGKPYMSQVPELKEKIKESVREHYGVDYVAQSEEVKQKSKETCLEKFGCEYASQNVEIQKKVTQTNIEKFGVPRASMLKEFQDKAKQTMMKNYGVPYATQSDIIKEKTKLTNIQKYGSITPMHNDVIKRKMKLSYYSTIYDKLYGDQTGREIVLMTSKDEFCQNHDNVDYLYKWHCNKCGNDFESRIDFNYPCRARCLTCYPIHSGHSKMENELIDFVRSVIGDETEMITGSFRIIPPHQLDIYIPSKNLAIEFDGLFWHSQQMLESEGKIATKYHLKKTEDCESKGIHLIHIFEDEWMFKKDIVKSRLRGLLNSYDKRIYARKCKIELIDPKTSREFVAQNHLQGSVNAGVNLALTYEDEIVSVMTFGNFRKSMGRTVEPNSYELLRFCSKLNYRVIGGAGKLFKRFIDQYKPYKVITYADRRWSLGNLYQKLGFQNMKKTSPNYWYVVNGHREYRFKYRKNDLHNLLEHFDPNKTEYENMLANGIDRVFDCGNYSFDLVYPENKVEEKKETEDSELLF